MTGLNTSIKTEIVVLDEKEKTHVYTKGTHQIQRYKQMESKTMRKYISRKQESQYGWNGHTNNIRHKKLT